MQNNVEQLISLLNLSPHPEGGYFKETYRSESKIPYTFKDLENPSERNVSTCIYFLLTSDTFSAFHRIRQDEIWHFYSGSTIELHTISPKGAHNVVSIGQNVVKGQVPQYVVSAGDWFAAKVTDENSYSLLGCTVAPGFDFADFHLAKQDELSTLFPEHRSLIEKFTRI
jgi:hypothetical protein